MITKDNISLYKDLFDKANKLLKQSGLLPEDPHINNIDEYFQHLGYIRAALEKQGAFNDISYFMLPLDEPLFEINANTRTIKIPDEFKNGISVQGDEVAETIFFSIDRYYDTTDFYDDYIIPVIQWKYADENGPGAYKLSAATGKIVMEDLNSDIGGTIKVVFGWPISSDVTERAEKIQFSVRFYTMIDRDTGELITNQDKFSEGELEYSFSTLNAITKINPSLNVSMDGSTSYSDKNYLLWKRMRNSKPADLNLQAISPIIDYFTPEAGTMADLNENGKLTLRVKAAYPSGTFESRLGQQLYEIFRLDHSNEELYDSGIAPSFDDTDINNENFDVDYIEVDPKKESQNSTIIYYQKIDDVYIPYKDSGLIPGLFKRVYTYKVDRAGKYYVKVTNILSDTNKASHQSGMFEIALPAIPTVGSVNDKYNNYILRYQVDEDGIPTQEVIPEELSLTVIDNDDGIALKYRWWKAETENSEKIKLNEIPNDMVEFNVFEPGYYFLEAINTRNNETVSKMSEYGIRVTYPATEPDNFTYFWGSDENYQLEIKDKDTVAPGAFTIYPQAERYDSFQYEWYRAGEDKTILSSTNTIKLNDSDRGHTYYCKVSSIFNGDKSTAVSTKQFTVV